MNEIQPETYQTPELSMREAECLTWCARGKSSWEIGRILNLSEDTINYHIKNAMRKLEASSRIEAVAKAVKLDLIEPWPNRGDMALPMIVAFLSEDLTANPPSMMENALRSDYVEFDPIAAEKRTEELSSSFPVQLSSAPPSLFDQAVHLPNSPLFRPDSGVEVLAAALVIDDRLPHVSGLARSEEAPLRPSVQVETPSGAVITALMPDHAFDPNAKQAVNDEAANPIIVRGTPKNDRILLDDTEAQEIILGSSAVDQPTLLDSSNGAPGSLDISGNAGDGQDTVIFTSLEKYMTLEAADIIVGLSTDGPDKDKLDLSQLFDQAHIENNAKARADLIEIDQTGALSIAIDGEKHVVAILQSLSIEQQQDIAADIARATQYVIQLVSIDPYSNGLSPF